MTIEQQRALALANARMRAAEAGAAAPAAEGPAMPPGVPPPGYASPELPSQWEQFQRGLAAIAENPSLLLDIGPAKMAKEAAKSAASAATLPGDVAQGKVKVPESFGPETPDAAADPVVKRSLELGALATPLPASMRAGERAIAGATKNLKKPPPPSAEALHAAGDAGYKEARALGVEYSSEAIANLAKTVKGELEAQGLVPKIAEKTHGILDELSAPPAGSVATITGVDAARRAFGELGGKFADASEQKAAIAARKAIQDFLENPPAEAVVAGAAAAAGKLATDARGNIAAGYRSDRLQGIERAAGLRASAANSGQNLDNSIRNRIASVLLNEKQSAGFNRAEIAALERINAGVPGANSARWIGNVLGGGGGLGHLAASATSGGVGAFLGGPFAAAAGAAVPTAIGVSAKKVANALTERALKKADELVRSRSPLHEQAPMVPAVDRRAEIIRALLLAQEQDAPPLEFTVPPSRARR